RRGRRPVDAAPRAHRPPVGGGGRRPTRLAHDHARRARDAVRRGTRPRGRTHPGGDGRRGRAGGGHAGGARRPAGLPAGGHRPARSARPRVRAGQRRCRPDRRAVRGRLVRQRGGPGGGTGARRLRRRRRRRGRRPQRPGAVDRRGRGHRRGRTGSGPVTARPTVDGSLPTLDEHATVIAATVDEVWPVLAETIAGSFRGRVWAAYAALVGSEHTQPAGPRPLAVGSTVVGFRVVVADPGRELRLEGSHRFSTYALSFRLEPVDNRSTRLVA